MVKYKALLVAPNGDWKVMYEKDSIEAVKKELEKNSDKLNRFNKFIILSIKITNRISAGSKVVYAPEEFKFMEGWNIIKVVGWFIDRYIESHPIGNKNYKLSRK